MRVTSRKVSPQTRHSSGKKREKRAWKTVLTDEGPMFATAVRQLLEKTHLRHAPIVDETGARLKFSKASLTDAARYNRRTIRSRGLDHDLAADNRARPGCPTGCATGILRTGAGAAPYQEGRARGDAAASQHPRGYQLDSGSGLGQRLAQPSGYGPRKGKLPGLRRQGRADDYAVRNG